MPNKRICIGKVSSAHGIKGLVKVLPYCEDLSLLNGKLFTKEIGNETITITLKNSSGKYILAEIEGIQTREQAEIIKCPLFVSRDTLPEVDSKDEFYIEDLIGLTAKTPDNEIIGLIQTIQDFGAGDLLEIKPRSGESYFVPFQDEFIQEISLDNKEITIQNHTQFIIE